MNMLMRGLLTMAVLATMLTACGSHDAATPVAETGCEMTGDLRLVYTGGAGEGGGDLFGLSKDGRVRRLTSDGGSFDPAFSPSGDRIVFSSIGADGSANGDTGISGLDLYVMDADGSRRQRLLDGDEDGMPAWSPDGHRIAFVRHLDTDHRRIFVVDPAAPANVHPLVDPGSGAFDTDPAWSPDGTRIAFVRSVPGKDPQAPWQYRLIVVDADGSNARTVLERDVPFTSPSWNADAGKIAFTLGPVGERIGSIAVVDVDSGAVHTLPGPGRAPVWSMSGRLYAYARNPAVADFSGGWRVAEFETNDRGVAKGRRISAIDANGYLYGDVGIDVPRCDGSDTSALTSNADVPETLTVTNPATGEATAVMTRDEVLESDHLQVLDGMKPEAKLVPGAILNGILDWGVSPEEPTDLVWVAAVPQSGLDGVVTVVDARTGDFLGSGPTMTDVQWSALADLAP